MAKRKRDTTTAAANGGSNASKINKTNEHIDVKTTSPVIQIVAGSYDRVLHGITASIYDLSSSETSPSVQFADTFLFNAHASAVRCLALSPLPDPGSSETQGVYLATGGSDEKINVYSLSASPVAANDEISGLPLLGNTAISENPRNRELGTLLQHSSNISALHFPTRSKFLSASEDNTIAVTRLKDLTVVSTIKAPRPKVQGQPSGDTNPQGATPAGVNDFAVHPSLKLMVSVGRGERCMRLWNLVTGKKAGVLNFSRETLQSAREGKYSSGEGRRIRWSPDGSEFAVAFERGVVVFGEDSRAKCRVLPMPLTKLHQICYVSLPDNTGEETTLLAVSTEDGRILFYNTRGIAMSPIMESANKDDNSIVDALFVSQLGGKAAGIANRIKDFEILSLSSPTISSARRKDLAIITAHSDGAVRLFHLPTSSLLVAAKSKTPTPPQIGKLIGLYETGNRITCLRAFVMLEPAAVDEHFGDKEDEFEGFEESQSESESDAESDLGDK